MLRLRIAAFYYWRNELTLLSLADVVTDRYKLSDAKLVEPTKPAESDVTPETTLTEVSESARVQNADNASTAATTITATATTSLQESNSVTGSSVATAEGPGANPKLPTAI